MLLAHTHTILFFSHFNEKQSVFRIRFKALGPGPQKGLLFWLLESYKVLLRGKKQQSQAASALAVHPCV